ncbi:hypothetical protein SprV_0602134800 [Sparganum proliferum]
MRQESNQCVSDFITNLTLAIQDCGYKEIKADNFGHAMLVQQLIVGLRNEKARENLLSEKKDLSWEKACDIASHQERVRQNLQQLNQSNDGVIASLESEMAVSLVNTAVSSPRHRPSAPSKQLPSCYRCGQHHIRWSDCRHQKTVCQFCKKIGHIERVCFSKRRANTNTHATYPNPAEDGEAILRMFSANALLQSPYTITLPVNHHPVKFEIDTGSAVTLINEASLQKLPSLLPASSTFRSYTGQNVEVRGVFTAEVEHDGELHYLPVHVVRGSQQPNLLGQNWIKCVPSVLSYVHRIGANPALDSILVNHKDLFRDDSATHYRGSPVKFQFQSDFRPRFFKARTVPYAVAPKVEEELDRLQKADIIEPVQYSEWAAPIVPVLKSDGSVRMCGDYKLTINSATKLNPYPLPRIEDLYASLAGGHQFTTLDLKHAYNQVVLHTESRDATTINTYRGLFRYKRLPFGNSFRSLNVSIWPVDLIVSERVRVPGNRFYETAMNPNNFFYAYFNLSIGTPFDINCASLMISLFDRDNNGTIDINEFGQLFNYITQWKQLFEQHDRDRSGSIDYNEFRSALRHFRQRRGAIGFDKYIYILVCLQILTDQFRVMDTSMTGTATISFEQFLAAAFRLST